MEFDDHHHRLPHHHHRDVHHQRSEDEEDDEEEEEEASDEMQVMNTNTNHSAVTSGGGGNVSLSRARMVEALSQVQIQPTQAMAVTVTPPSRPTYRECLKNHAINVMGHALDGCCEFMPAGPEGSIDALKCAACGCHRNFHRKEEAVGEPGSMLYSLSHPHLTPQPQPAAFGSYYRSPVPSGYLHLGPTHPTRPLALPSSSGGGGGAGGSQDDDMSNPNGGVGAAVVIGGSSSNGKKRFRTKFTLEQKEKMLAMADRIGWRIQRSDEELVQHFCQEAAVKRHVFKVWMHNNKHTLGRAAATNNNVNNNIVNSSSRQHQQLMD